MYAIYLVCFLGMFCNIDLSLFSTPGTFSVGHAQYLELLKGMQSVVDLAVLAMHGSQGLCWACRLIVVVLAMQRGMRLVGAMLTVEWP